MKYTSPSYNHIYSVYKPHKKRNLVLDVLCTIYASKSFEVMLIALVTIIFYVAALVATS